MSRKYVPVKTESEGDDVWLGYINLIRNKSIEVIEENLPPQDTGLVDQYGNKLVCIEVTDQIGFIRRKQFRG